MKFTKKLGIVAIAAVMMVASVLAFAACGEKPSTLVGSYNSDAKYTFFSAYPNFTYKQATFTVQNLKVFDDDTYRFTVSSTSFSGALEFPDEGESSAYLTKNAFASMTVVVALESNSFDSIAWRYSSNRILWHIYSRRG